MNRNPTPMLDVPLHAIAHGRAGDKGDTSNISVIGYEARTWPILVDQVTEARVLALFRPLGATAVDRYELPKLNALNFVIANTLGGGVNASLRLDRHGKGLSFHLLGGLTVEIPSALLPSGSPYRARFTP